MNIDYDIEALPGRREDNIEPEKTNAIVWRSACSSSCSNLRGALELISAATGVWTTVATLRFFWLQERHLSLSLD